MSSVNSPAEVRITAMKLEGVAGKRTSVKSPRLAGVTCSTNGDAGTTGGGGLVWVVVGGGGGGVTTICVAEGLVVVSCVAGTVVVVGVGTVSGGVVSVVGSVERVAMAI